MDGSPACCESEFRMSSSSRVQPSTTSSELAFRARTTGQLLDVRLLDEVDAATFRREQHGCDGMATLTVHLEASHRQHDRPSI
jgi:hypothetical protein